MYWKYVKMHIRSIAQYRFSFWLTVTAQFFGSFLIFIGMILLFAKFKTIAGWSFSEAALCFGVIQFSFAFAECFSRGFDQFQRLIIKGEYDRLLVRPRSTVLQVFGSAFELSRIGRLLQSLAILLYAVCQPGFDWSPMKITTLILMILSGVVVFTGIFILGATFCFFTVEGLEVINIFTDGGREIAQYPLSIYQKWIQRFFTFVIPLGCVNYLPLLYLTGRVSSHAVLYMLSPLAGFLFLIPALLLWRFGERHYLSTGS